MSGTSSVSADARPVLITGAGFSREISREMPLTDELGNLCVGHAPELAAHVPSDGFVDGRFEVWLSELATDQPFLSAVENLENRALFQRFADAIAAVITDRVVVALAEDWPRWLPTLVKLSHVVRATIITFNYDTLIECAVDTDELLRDPDHRDPVHWGGIIGEVPPWPSGGMRWGSTPVETLKLLKLHGSLNWYWTPGDLSGASVARRMLPGHFRWPLPYSEEERRRELPGRAPLIVPPTASKASYYSNPIIKELWQSAADALEAASKIVVMGYSLPQTDLTFNALLVHALRHNPAPIHVADLVGAAVAGRLDRLGFEGRVEVVGGRNPIEEYVARWCHEVARDCAEALRESKSLDDPMMVAWGENSFAAVVEVVRDRDGSKLVLESPNLLSDATRSREGQQVLPTLRDACGDTLAPVRVVVEGKQQYLIHASTTRANAGYGSGLWNVLMTSGPKPSEPHLVLTTTD